MATGSDTGTGEDGRLRRLAELLRRHPGLVVVVGVIGLAVGIALTRSSDEPGSDASGVGSEESPAGDPVHEPPSGSRSADDDAVGTEGDDGAEGAGGAGATTAGPAGQGQETTTTTLVPPDVARPRPEIDLDVPPGSGDPVEVARWWAATYVAYVGAGPADELVDRLESLTTPDLQDDLASVPSGASYGDPVPISGVSAGQLAGGDQREQKVRVVVETPDALVVYTLVLQRGTSGWQVSEATRL